MTSTTPTNTAAIPTDNNITVHHHNSIKNNANTQLTKNNGNNIFKIANLDNFVNQAIQQMDWLIEAKKILSSNGYRQLLSLLASSSQQNDMARIVSSTNVPYDSNHVSLSEHSNKEIESFLLNLHHQPKLWDFYLKAFGQNLSIMFLNAETGTPLASPPSSSATYHDNSNGNNHLYQHYAPEPLSASSPCSNSSNTRTFVSAVNSPISSTLCSFGGPTIATSSPQLQTLQLPSILKSNQSISLNTENIQKLQSQHTSNLLSLPLKQQDQQENLDINRQPLNRSFSKKSVSFSDDLCQEIEFFEEQEDVDVFDDDYKQHENDSNQCHRFTSDETHYNDIHEYFDLDHADMNINDYLNHNNCSQNKNNVHEIKVSGTGTFYDLHVSLFDRPKEIMTLLNEEHPEFMEKIKKIFFSHRRNITNINNNKITNEKDKNYNSKFHEFLKVLKMPREKMDDLTWINSIGKYLGSEPSLFAYFKELVGYDYHHETQSCEDFIDDPFYHLSWEDMELGNDLFSPRSFVIHKMSEQNQKPHVHMNDEMGSIIETNIQMEERKEKERENENEKEDALCLQDEFSVMNINDHFDWLPSFEFKSQDHKNASETLSSKSHTEINEKFTTIYHVELRDEPELMSELEYAYPLFFNIAHDYFEQELGDVSFYDQFMDILSTPRCIMDDQEWTLFILEHFFSGSVQLTRMFKSLVGVEEKQQYLNDACYSSISSNGVFSDRIKHGDHHHYAQRAENDFCHEQEKESNITKQKQKDEKDKTFVPTTRTSSAIGIFGLSIEELKKLDELRLRLSEKDLREMISDILYEKIHSHYME